MEEKNNQNQFNIILLGVIFDPAKRKILIGRRENDAHVPDLKWCFPSGRLTTENKVDETLKSKIKEKTGYDVKNLGTIFSRISPEDKEFFQVYFLCQVFKGDEKPGDDLVELKWVNPEEVEKYFNTTFNTRLKEYIMSLK